MSNPVLDYATKKKAFELLCDRKGWSFYHFTHNNKNRTQCLGSCFDEDGEQINVLVTDQGHIVRLLGDKKYEEIV